MALVRVKRRAQDDPIDVLLLACKKFKADEVHPVEAAVFKFAATVNEQAGDLKTHLDQAVSSAKVPLKYRLNELSSITRKLREENKLLSKNSRLKVVNCFRALEPQTGDDGPCDEADERKPLTVVDIETEPSTREVPTDSSNSEAPITEEQYVYDLYYSKVKDFDDLMLENVLSVHEVDEKLIFGDYINESDNEPNVVDDEDDSNDENNWRNDYPDEEEGDDRSSIDEDDMRLAMGLSKVCIDGEYHSDLSSDQEDEALIYGIDDKGHYHYQTSSNSDSDYYQ